MTEFTYLGKARRVADREPALLALSLRRAKLVVGEPGSEL